MRKLTILFLILVLVVVGQAGLQEAVNPQPRGVKASSIGFKNCAYVETDANAAEMYNWLASSERDGEMGALSNTNRRNLMVIGNHTQKIQLVQYVDIKGVDANACITAYGQTTRVLNIPTLAADENDITNIIEDITIKNTAPVSAACIGAFSASAYKRVIVLRNVQLRSDYYCIFTSGGSRNEDYLIEGGSSFSDSLGAYSLTGDGSEINFRNHTIYVLNKQSAENPTAFGVKLLHSGVKADLQNCIIRTDANWVAVNYTPPALFYSMPVSVYNGTLTMSNCRIEYARAEPNSTPDQNTLGIGIDVSGDGIAYIYNTSINDTENYDVNVSGSGVCYMSNCSYDPNKVNGTIITKLPVATAAKATGLIITDGVTGNVTIDSNSYELADANLTAIADLTGTGYIKRTGNGIVSLSIPITWVSTQFDKTSDTNLAAIPGLSATLTAEQTYSFDIFLFVTSGVTGLAKVDLAGGTCTATSVIWDLRQITTGTGKIIGRASALDTTQGATSSGIIEMEIVGTITVNVGGTFIPRFTQAASSANTSSVLVGSFMEVAH